MGKKNRETKEDKHMEAINKPQEAMMIAQGMTKAFIDLLAAQKYSKAYWDECSSTGKRVSSSTMDKLKRICNGENDV